MSVTLYYMSGSPYSWRVWLALEHKGVPHQLRTMSYDTGDLKKAEFAALNPRRRVPVLVDDGFALYESAAILDYVEEKWPRPSLLAADLHERAIQRRMIREADQYLATAMEQLVDAILFTPKERWSAERIAAAAADLRAEIATWEELIAGEYLAGPLSAVDFTMYPMVALTLRLARRKPDLAADEWLGSKMRAWTTHMEKLPIVQKTWPPHWKS